jgi:hypothetical protein
LNEMLGTSCCWIIFAQSSAPLSTLGRRCVAIGRSGRVRAVIASAARYPCPARRRAPPRFRSTPWHLEVVLVTPEPPTMTSPRDPPRRGEGYLATMRVQPGALTAVDGDPDQPEREPTHEQRKKDRRPCRCGRPGRARLDRDADVLQSLENESEHQERGTDGPERGILRDVLRSSDESREEQTRVSIEAECQRDCADEIECESYGRGHMTTIHEPPDSGQSPEAPRRRQSPASSCA